MHDPTQSCAPEHGIGLAYRLCLFFFVFPLFAPALAGTVIYPFVLYGIFLFWTRRLKRRALYAVLAAGAMGSLYTLVDAAAALRMVAFVFGCLFINHTLSDAERTRMMLRLAVCHGWLVVLQFLLVMAGIELDFSALLRAVYGELLPPTGQHIDYNAFSQLDVFLPRVAGLNREPAYASVLFLGLLYVAARLRHWKAATVLLAALLCTLSKIVFPLLLAFALLYLPLRRARRARRPAAAVGRLLAFVAVNLAVVYGVKSNIELVESAMLLDASYYHRFIGLYAMSEDFEAFSAVGNSKDTVSSDAIFDDYEFLDDRRAFLDGSVLSKVLVDLGYVAAAAYAVIVALVCVSWPAAAALGLAGLFINFLSISPATILLFSLISGLSRPERPQWPQSHRGVHSFALAKPSHV